MPQFEVTVHQTRMATETIEAKDECEAEDLILMKNSSLFHWHNVQGKIVAIKSLDEEE
jgi:hypothetical protein